MVWDPGGKRDEPMVSATDSLYHMISTAMGSVHYDEYSKESRTELDSHANMPVVGRHAYVLSNTGRTVDVNAFTPDYEPIRVPVVDAAVQYDCPYTGISHMMVIRNALHVPSMENNLIPPFIMREAGIEVNEVAKIQVPNPSEEDHSIYFKETNLRIPLALWGVFSYFPTYKPTARSLSESDDVYLITPTRWNPHQIAYAQNEDAMLDSEGYIIPKRQRQQVMLTDIMDDDVMSSSLQICSTEANAAEALSESWNESNKESENWKDFQYDEAMLCKDLHEQAEIGHFRCSIGSTNVTCSDYLAQEHITEATTDSDDSSDEDPDDEDEELLRQVYEDVQSGQLDLDEIMASATHATNNKGVDPEHLAKIWRIDHDTAKRTIEITGEQCQRTDDPKLSRNYGTNDRMLRYKHISEYFYMDTFFATKKAKKSSRGNTCCQLFVTDKGFVYVVPMKSKSEVIHAVKQFAKEIGAPDAIISDAAREQKSQELRKFCNEIGTSLRILEEGTPWANRAELYIGLIKEAVRKDMKESDCPLVFWDYCTERRARINNLTAKTMFKLHGSNAHSILTGEEGDISSLSRYGFYQWCYYREQSANFPFNKEVLGRVLGPARGEGNEMSQWILKGNGNVVPRRSLRPLNTSELHSPTEQKKRDVFDALIERRWGTSINPPKTETLDTKEEWEEYEDSDEDPRIIPDMDDVTDNKGHLINQQPAYDRLINAEVQLQLDDEVRTARVTKRAIGPDGKTTGTYDDNPVLNSVVYEVEFPDGQVKEYSANVIAENMLTQVDSEGFSTTLMEAIVDHRRDPAVATSKDDKYVITKSGQKRLRKTTVGWKLLVRWRNGNEDWIPLKDLKESNPVETAEFARARGIADEPAFVWWVPYTLRKRDVILSAVKSRLRRVTHKYGIEVPTTIEHAFKIDEANNNTFWRDAIEKEMKNVGVAFELLGDGVQAPHGWHKVTGHLVFDVKMDFTRKARWVLDGHKTPNPIGSTYAGVVSRESVRIAFTYAALNGVDVFAADIRNAYLQAPSSQKDYVICGAEFGLENIGKVALIHRALYGGKSAGRDFRNHLRSCMRHLDFVSCPADPDVWMRPAKKADGSTYYEYILLYTDDALVVSENAEQVLRKDLGRYFELKEESIGAPKIYLGGHVRKVQLENGVECWAFSSSQYVQAAVNNVQTYLAKQTRYRLPAKAETPLTTTYRPELDVSPELNPVLGAYYQSLIGILRWIVELGRVDICLEVSMMSSHLALPRDGHLEQLFHIFGYLKKYHNTEMVYDPSDPVIDEETFQLRDWASSEFGHLQGKEELPPNMPAPRGIGFRMRAKVDADHASDTVTRRSRTGFLVYLNCSLVHWFSKKQTSVESSSFGSEFIAMKQCCEYVRGLRYKLRMMGIPCDEPTFIQGDNQSVLANTTIPDSTLKKKSQSIAYHFVREGVARDEWRTTYVNTHDNEADLLTKTLPSGKKRRGFIRNLLHHIFGSEEVD